MDIEITQAVYVDGEPKKKGDVVKGCKSANLLIGMGKAKKLEAKPEVAKKVTKKK